MASCDMCGKEGILAKVDVEGAILDLCKGCTKFGKIITPPRRILKKSEKEKIRPVNRQRAPPTEMIQVIVSNYGSLIRKIRQKLDLTQEEFAKKINEKESMVAKMEKEQFRPSISLARKLEKILKIKLVEEHEEKKIISGEQRNSKGFTMADFIKDKRK